MLVGAQTLQVTHLVHVRSDVLVLNDDEELVQAAAVFQKRLRAALAVAETLQVLLSSRGGRHGIVRGRRMNASSSLTHASAE